MRFRPPGLDRQRCFELQGPERQVDQMAAEVRHRAVAKVPPAVPFRTGEIIVVERPGRRRALPQIPVQAGWDGAGPLGRADHDEAILGIAGRLLTFVPAPGTRMPDVNFANRANRADWISSTTRR